MKVVQRDRHGGAGSSARMPSRSSGHAHPAIVGTCTPFRHQAPSERCRETVFCRCLQLLFRSRQISPASTPISFCLGISSAGMSGRTMSESPTASRWPPPEDLARLNSAMTFVYVSGAGTDSSRTWKSHVGPREGQDRKHALLAPSVQRRRTCSVPASSNRWDGIKSDSILSNLLRVDQAAAPAAAPGFSQSHSHDPSIAKAMLIAARTGTRKTILESRDIYALAAGSP